MSSTITRPMTFAEFEKLPDHPHGFPYELRHGEMIELPPPIHRHHMIQQRLRRLLESAAGNAGEVTTELGFKIGERNYRIADVAFLFRQTWQDIPLDGYLERPRNLW